jgi:hypothetical protein
MIIERKVLINFIDIDPSIKLKLYANDNYKGDR